MGLDSDKANLTRQYLLGALSRVEEERLEEEFFINDESFQDIEIAEDELVDAYVRGELPENERRQFESKLAELPRLAERIKFAQVLERANPINPTSTDATGINSAKKLAPVAKLSKDDSPDSQNILSLGLGKQSRSWRESIASWLVPTKIGAAACAVVLLVAGAGLFRDWLRLRSENKQLATQREYLQQQNQVATSKAETERQEHSVELQNAEAEIASLMKRIEDLTAQVGSALPSIPLVLYPGGSRDPSTSGKDVALPIKPSRFEVWLVLSSSDYQKYNAVVTRVGGDDITHVSNLKLSNYKSSPALKLKLSSTLLRRGNYIVTVNGLPASNQPVFVTSYSFRMTDRD